MGSKCRDSKHFKDTASALPSCIVDTDLKSILFYDEAEY